MILDLRFARINRLVFKQQSWPQLGNLFLNGLVYESINDIDHLKWLRQQFSKEEESKNIFFPQPYEQLAQVLQASGYESAAKKSTD